MTGFLIEIFSTGAHQELQSREVAATATEVVEKLAAILSSDETHYVVRDDKGIRHSIMELKKLAAKERDS